MVRKSTESRIGMLARLLETLKEFFIDKKGERAASVDERQLNDMIDRLNKMNDSDPVTIECEGITFIVSASNMDPKPKLRDKTIDVVLSMKYDWQKDGSIREKKTEEEKKDSNSCIYECNIQIKGNNAENGVRRKFAWHLDCEENTEGKYIHPHFHFHAGGKKISGMGTGELLMISSPRIAYPPMDLPLAINFVIHNFVHRNDMSEQYAILGNRDYKWVVGESVKKVLRPYFNFVNEKLETNENHYFPVIV